MAEPTLVVEEWGSQDCTQITEMYFAPFPHLSDEPLVDVKLKLFVDSFMKSREPLTQPMQL